MDGPWLDCSPCSYVGFARTLWSKGRGRWGLAAYWWSWCSWAGALALGAVLRSADEWFELGQRELARRKYVKAEQAFSKFLEEHPQDRRRPEALLGLADALDGAKRYEVAKFQYRRFLELFPTRPEAAKVQFNSANVFLPAREDHRSRSNHDARGRAGIPTFDTRLPAQRLCG